MNDAFHIVDEDAEWKKEQNGIFAISDSAIINSIIANGLETIEKDDDKEDTKSTGAERAQWGNGIEFLFSCIAMSVGLGNIWRFPFTAYENGGGAFLIPYLIVLVLVGRPVYYLEMCLGQFTSRANVKAFGALAPAVLGN